MSESLVRSEIFFTAMKTRTNPTMLMIGPAKGIKLPIRRRIAPIPPKVFALPKSDIIFLTLNFLVEIVWLYYNVSFFSYGNRARKPNALALG